VLNHEGSDSSLNYSNYIYENGYTQVEGDNEEVIEEIEEVEEDKIKVDYKQSKKK
jgi:hypothetical protein